MKKSILASVILLTLVFGTVTAQAQCAGDTNQDNNVDVVDLLAILAAWGDCGGACGVADTNGDQRVDVVDLLAILAAWGPCPSTDCPFDCMEADIFCLFEGGVLHADLTCADSGFCCEVPTADPCPETCVENPFACLEAGGSPLDAYTCGDTGSCCALP